MSITRIRLDDQAQDATLTPAKVSVVATDDFTFPRDVIAAQDLTATTKVNSDKVAGRTGNLILAPFANNAASVRITKADGTTAVLSVDTTNGRIGIGNTSPTAQLDVAGAGKFSGGLLSNDVFTLSSVWRIGVNASQLIGPGDTPQLGWGNAGEVDILAGLLVAPTIKNTTIKRSFDGSEAINVDAHGLTTTANQNSLDWEGRHLIATTGITLDWEESTLIHSGGVMLNWATTGVLDVNSNKISSVGNPSSAQDAATKFYVDSIASGLAPKAASRAATTAALPTSTYNNGAAGVGATLTKTTNGALPAQDGVTLVNGDRLLVKDQAAALQNGIYDVTDVGSAGTPFILTRSADFDGSPANEVEGGSFTFVTSGAVNGSTGWSVVWSGAITVGTDPVNFTQTSAAGTFIAGNGIDITGNTISAVVDGITLDFATNQLEVKAGGITDTQVSATANIVYSKLLLTGAIVNADINATAAIAYPKLNLTGSIINADVAAGAAIAYTKLTAAGSDREVQFNNAGTPGSSANLKYTQGANNTIILGSASNAVQLWSNNSGGDGHLDTGSADFHLSTSGGTYDFVGGVLTLPGDLDLATNQIHNVVDPTSAQDAATKAYVDAIMAAHTVTRETPSGAIDGVNDTFVLDFTPTAGTEMVFLNGLLQNEGSGNDYTISSDTITFEAAAIPETGSTLLVTYQK